MIIDCLSVFNPEVGAPYLSDAYRDNVAWVIAYSAAPGSDCIEFVDGEGPFTNPGNAMKRMIEIKSTKEVFLGTDLFIVPIKPVVKPIVL